MTKINGIEVEVGQLWFNDLRGDAMWCRVTEIVKYNTGMVRFRISVEKADDPTIVGFSTAVTPSTLRNFRLSRETPAWEV